LKYTLTQIKGNAKASCGNKIFENWEDLKCHLQNLYQDRKHYSQIFHELTELKQNTNESMTQFISRAENVQKRCLQAVTKLNSEGHPISIEKLIELLIVARFQYYSNSEISKVLRLKKFNSLNETITCALEEERVERMLFTKNNSHTKKVCQTCHKVGHTQAECYRNKRPVNIVNENEQMPQNRSIQPNTKFKQCNYCKKRGHTIDECYSRKKAAERASDFKNNNQKNVSTLPVEVTTPEQNSQIQVTEYQ
jgi:hypothetical protein